MNEMIRAAPVLVLATALAACSPAGTSANNSHALAGTEQDSGPPLAGSSIGGPFTLTDQDGKIVHDTDFAGKYRIMYFGYTFCPDVCPQAMQHLGAAMRTLDKQDPALSHRIVPMFISVDPARDTPAVLKQFVGAFYPRLIGLTGSPQTIRKVADEYHIFYKKQPPGPGGGYLVQHTTYAYLLDPQGKPLATVPVTEQPPAILDVIKRWAT